MGVLKEYFSKSINWIYRLLTKNKPIVVLIIIVGLVGPWQSLWSQIFPPIPQLSTNSITIPPFTTDYQEKISVFNPRDNHYSNLIIKFEGIDDYKLLPFSLIIEPTEHLLLSHYEGLGTLDSNFVAFYENGNKYLKINKLKAREKLDYNIKFTEEVKDEQEIKVNIVEYKELEKFDATPFFLYFINRIVNGNKCDMEQWPTGIKNGSRRINSCFGGMRANYSGNPRKAISLNMWLFPEWKEEGINFIFDTGPQEERNRLSIYRYNNYLITEIYESNGYKHLFEEEVEFKHDWNDLYFSLNAADKNYILYLNNQQVINYTFHNLEFKFPDLYYYGINANENSELRQHGNFRLDEMGLWNVTLSEEDINQLYNNGTGCFYGEPCLNESS